MVGGVEGGTFPPPSTMGEGQGGGGGASYPSRANIASFSALTTG